MNKAHPALCLIVGFLALPAAAGAETIHFREAGGTGYTAVNFDDTYLKVSPSD
ncbi:unnamed protein product, partial [marine sediment metagenome]